MSSLRLPRLYQGARLKFSTSSSSVRLDTGFSAAKLGSFYQIEPVLHNPWLGDPTLRKYMQNVFASSSTPTNLTDVTSDFERFGKRIVQEIDACGRECELNLPRLEQYSPWGHRIDKLITSDAWKRQKTFSAEEGIVAIGYERKYDELSRIVQCAKLLMYTPSAGLYSCPLAMTDGAAKVIEALNLKSATGDAFERLTTRDAQRFWTSGQWMTERGGGSDVGGGTETVAIPTGRPGEYRLHGLKWFSSATDSDMALALARPVESSESGPARGSGGLAMFFLATHDSSSNLNNIEIVRLKNKLGTRQVPTAELLLKGTLATRLTEVGQGVQGIAHMLNITRLHNAVGCAGAMRRILMLARDYMMKRRVFGKALVEQPLHVKTLAEMEVETRGCTLFVMEVARLLGKIELAMATKNEAVVFRMLTSVLKLYTAKKAVAHVSEGLESFGGLGYIEDSGLPCLFRDAQVFPIWEGTTNVLSLDFLRTLAKNNGIDELSQWVTTRLDKASRVSSLADACKATQERFSNFHSRLVSGRPELLEIQARDIAFDVGRITVGSLLLEQAATQVATETDISAANHFCLGERYGDFFDFDENKALVLEGL